MAGRRTIRSIRIPKLHGKRSIPDGRKRARMVLVGTTALMSGAVALLGAGPSVAAEFEFADPTSTANAIADATSNASAVALVNSEADAVATDNTDANALALFNSRALAGGKATAVSML